ncbi:MAG: hypothetical protein ACLRQF_05850 [Thomasclavelia ramosa]
MLWGRKFTQEIPGYFVAPNHQGLFDPLAIFQTHSRQFSNRKKNWHH